MSGLPEASGRPHTFEAADYDTLVDGPIVAGELKVYEFTRSGKPHYLVNVNEGGNWDGARAITDMDRIVAEHEKLWGSLPYDKYVFINMITEAGGGLEHRNSSVLMTSRWAMGTRQSYVGWLNLVSHEYFHVWNVKRLRPAALGPFDYENENYTPSLWVSEGITSYYGDLLVRRAGLSSDAEFFDIGTPPGYLHTASHLALREGKPLDRGERCVVHATARIERTVLWNDVTVESGASLVECIVADGVTVPAGQHFERCALVSVNGKMLAAEF